ncbi:hypothetical protein, partial [Bacteroides hominis]|uniref:hypothetical protein n=1 Tax=Bacteroides hominis TaxID=2763023 RepID=UPI001D0E8AFE
IVANFATIAAEGKVYQTEHYDHIQRTEINISIHVSISFFSNYSKNSSSSSLLLLSIFFDHYLAKRTVR